MMLIIVFEESKFGWIEGTLGGPEGKIPQILGSWLMDLQETRVVLMSLI